MKYYSKLYQKSDIPINLINKYLNNVNLPNYLTISDCKMCDLDFTTEEVRKTVKTLKLNKSPGMVGLTYEFYQTFWDQLEANYMYMIKESFEKKIFFQIVLKMLF